MNKKLNTNASRIAQNFTKCHQKGQFAVDALDYLIDYAISPDDVKAKIGTHVLFSQIIESLSDSFLSEDRKTLEKILAHLISRIRILDQAKDFHKKLLQLNMNCEEDLLNRIDSHPMNKKCDPLSLKNIKKIFIPSRVTLGADVLLNTIVIEKMKRQFPNAEIVFLGNQKNGMILKGNQKMIRIHPLQYNRRGTVIHRFLNWLELIKVLEEEINLLSGEDEYIFINTDSRILQSGLLPIGSLAEEENRYFFWRPSICYHSWHGTSQAEDLVFWLNSTFENKWEDSKNEKIYPTLHFQEDDILFAKNIFKHFNILPESYVVCMSFGVGGNQEKRIKQGNEKVSVFEIEIIKKLLNDDVIIILDKGFGRDEYLQANEILDTIKNCGFVVSEISVENLENLKEIKPNKASLIAFNGAVNKFSALIQLSNCFIGYDSLGQHLAAAVGNDTITVFAGYPSEIFPERWKPLGTGNIKLVNAKRGPYSNKQQNNLVDEVFKNYRSFKKTRKNICEPIY